jgi:hypothetical protein
MLYRGCPIFHRSWEMSYIFLINASVWAVTATFGGVLAMIFKKVQELKISWKR